MNTAPAPRPRKTPSPMFGLKNESRGGIFVADYRKFFQKTTKATDR